MPPNDQKVSRNDSLRNFYQSVTPKVNSDEVVQQSLEVSKRRLSTTLAELEEKDLEELVVAYYGGGSSKSKLIDGSIMNRPPAKGKKLALQDSIVSKLLKKAGEAKKRILEKNGGLPKSQPNPELGDENDDGGKKEEQKILFDTSRQGPTPFHDRSAIDYRDVGTPDAWITRHGSLERLSGRHPYNSEPLLSELLGSLDSNDGDEMKSKFLTPGHLHFVRNHGAVPKLTWEDHQIEVIVKAGYCGSGGASSSSQTKNGKKNLNLLLSMDDVARFSKLERPVSVVCIGNRRSEQNAVRRTIGFSWGPGAIATSQFQGAPLREILLKAGVSINPEDWKGCHVEFVGADELPNKAGPGPFMDEKWGEKLNYGTSVPLGKVMDPARDIMIAYKANGEYIPPDHGYPARILIPGSTGGRCVKWVKRITVIPHESHNLFHHHDNKILPPHVLDLEMSKDPIKNWWYNSDYIVHELNINSAVVRPGQDDTIDFEIVQPSKSQEDKDEDKDTNNITTGSDNNDSSSSSFEITGYAYAGGGRKVTRVEISFDKGSNWDLTDVHRNEEPTPHDMHWCWIFWSIEIPKSKLVESEEFWIRAWDETNNTQPLNLTWNLMGLGNNQVYKVKIHVDESVLQGKGRRWVRVRFEHPTQPGGIPGGWMKKEGGLPESAGYGPIQLPEAGGDDSAAGKSKEPARIITEEELQDHNKDDDVWIVVQGKVYDCTEYLSIHPGGKESIVIYGGKDCSQDFAAVHSLGATKLLDQYYIGDLEKIDIDTPEIAAQDDEIQKILDDLEEAMVDNPVKKAVQESIDFIDEKYGFRDDNETLNPADAVLVSETWEIIKATNLDAFTEALLARWRLLVTMNEIAKEEKENPDPDVAWIVHPVRAAMINGKAFALIKENKDPLATTMGCRLYFARRLLAGLLDVAVESLFHDETSVETHLFNDEELRQMGILDRSMDEYVRMFLRAGLQPEHWMALIRAFTWAISTHFPCENDAVHKDLAQPENHSAFFAFVSHIIARVAIKTINSIQMEYLTTPYLVLDKFCKFLREDNEEVNEILGEIFFTTLFTEHPEFVDYFPQTDMDYHAIHIKTSVLLILDTMENEMKYGSSWRKEVHRLNKVHKQHNIPPALYQIFGGTLMKVLGPLFDKEVHARKHGRFAITRDEIDNAFSGLLFEVANEMICSMVFEEMVQTDLERFMALLSKELRWSSDKLTQRLVETKLQLSAGTSYSHTIEELEAGARIAWRNSVSAFSRSTWENVKILDGRLVDTYEALSKAIGEHIQVAVTSDGNSGVHRNTVAVFAENSNEGDLWGIRFWNPSYFFYAGYMSEDGTVLGDPRNVDYTESLRRYGLWSPPLKKTEFDLLPIIVKLPNARPFAYEIPNKLRYEVELEHPSYSAFSSLGLKWPAIDFVSNVKMVLGGVEYQCCAYNKPFIVTEVVQGLCCRRGLIKNVASALGIDRNIPLLRERIELEIKVAVLHSYRKYGYLILDETEASSAYNSHCHKERIAGRPVLETDKVQKHRISARFEPSCYSHIATMASDDSSLGDSSNIGQKTTYHTIPKIMILYGSETGTCEATAYRLKRQLMVLKPKVMELNDAVGLDIVKEQEITHVIAICSTFNRGEFPFNARKFADKELAGDCLDGVKYTVLALGSSIYPDFCAAGIRLDEKLEQAGGKAFLGLTKVDGNKGGERQISDWLQQVTTLVVPSALKDSSGDDCKKHLEHRMVFLEPSDKSMSILENYRWPKEEPTFLCVANTEVAGEDRERARSVRKITFQLPPGCSYETGDHLSVQPLGSAEDVLRFGMCFKHELLSQAAQDPNCNDEMTEEEKIIRQLNRPFKVECTEGALGEAREAELWFNTPTSLSQLIQSQVDLRLNSSTFGDYLGMIQRAVDKMDESEPETRIVKTHSEALKEIESYSRTFSADGSSQEEAIASFISRYPLVVDFFEKFSFLCKYVNISNLISLLSRIQPRYYSISSSSKKRSESVSITVGVLQFNTPDGVLMKGFCSNYLAGLDPGEARVKVSVRTSAFRGPKDPTYPIVMVGPGTGLAPMMGFLEDRKSSLSTTGTDLAGVCHLFFGCRKHCDRIYREKIEQWESKGILQLHLALSREKGVPKAYVQDLMKRMGKGLFDLLQDPKTHVYICGDAKVANEVFDCCVDVLRVNGHMSRVKAAWHIKLMRSQNRWQYDLWGTVKDMDNIGTIKKKKLTESSISRANAWLKSIA